MRRRWTLRFQTNSGEDLGLVVYVPADESGRVRASIGTFSAVLEPQEVRRLRQIYLEAMAVAIWDRGAW
jgi:hypothetical protein